MNIRELAILSTAALIAWHPACAEPSASYDSAWAAAVEAWKAQIDAQGIAGSSLYFVHEGEVEGAEHYGYADLATKRQVDEDTIYHWASITKTFTAVGLMQLVERDLVSLDDPISDYLPEVRQVHNPFGTMEEITLRHLITHTSGFRGATFPWGGSEEWHPHEPAEWWQVAAMMPYSEIRFEPGSQYGYSNPGLSMLGRVIEEVTGDDIEVYLTKNILMPLGMTRSYFDHTPYHLLEDRSNNYVQAEGELTELGLDFDTGATVGNGGLNAPVSDMIRWLNFWLGVGDQPQIISRETLEQMWEPGYPTGDWTVEERMGMSFFIIDHPTTEGNIRQYVGHTGGQRGYVAFVYIDPERSSAALLTANTRVDGIERKDGLVIAMRKLLFETVFPVVRK